MLPHTRAGWLLAVGELILHPNSKAVLVPQSWQSWDDTSTSCRHWEAQLHWQMKGKSLRLGLGREGRHLSPPCIPSLGYGMLCFLRQPYENAMKI